MGSGKRLRLPRELLAGWAEVVQPPNSTGHLRSMADDRATLCRGWGTRQRKRAVK
jgi:hypothetical protein